MEFQYKNKTYDLDIEPITVVDGNTIYPCGEPKYTISSITLKENSIQIAINREQYFDQLDIYIGDKCGIYNLKMVANEIITLDNKYIESAIKNGGEVEIEEVVFKTVKEEFLDIEYVEGDELNENDIISDMSVDELYEDITLFIEEQ